MTRRMLIDAAHPEEKRVAVMDGNFIDHFDFVTSTKPQNKGNIYLAKVTRVEPSLQAVFVEYGAERQGFLPFSEVHPDYYQIPVADRRKLMEEVQAEVDAQISEGEKAAPSSASEESENAKEGEEEEDDVDILDEEEASAPAKSIAIHRRYRVNEVIKRNQVILIQVVKEERGNKGAAVTTYISLAGRYCVLMPNSYRQGGVSRKISGADERKKMRAVLDSLDLPQSMSLIIRTAGMGRTKAEIKRDFNYLVTLWNTIREDTLASTAPALVYEENNLIRRAIRDLYDSQTDEVLVEGEEDYKAAKGFMKTMMPSHAARVKLYKENAPIFHQYQAEQQLRTIYDSQVHLPSGGSIVLEATEALVSIDVNSGRSTGERNVEETATKTNLEAAREVARQLRLRDLSGLVVIDFIDMLDSRHRRQVERTLKDALKPDRARIQVGRISVFGLLEMSRQRLRPSVTENHTLICPTCSGGGRVFSEQAAALAIVRDLEEIAARFSDLTRLVVKASLPVVLYLLNRKRDMIDHVESLYNLEVEVTTTDEEIGTPGYALEAYQGDNPVNLERRQEKQRGGRRGGKRRRGGRDDEDENRSFDREERKDRPSEEEGEDKPRSRSRRRRRKSGENENSENRETAQNTEATPEEKETPPTDTADAAEDKPEAKPGRKRLRGGKSAKPAAVNDNEESAPETAGQEAEEEKEAKPAARKRRSAKTAKPEAESAKEEAEGPSTEESPAKKPEKATVKKDARKTQATVKSAEPAENKAEKEKAEPAPSPSPLSTLHAPVENKEAAGAPKNRKGWWHSLLDS